MVLAACVCVPSNDPNYLKRVRDMFQRGYHMINAGSDVGRLRDAALAEVKEFRSVYPAAERGRQREGGPGGRGVSVGAQRRHRRALTSATDRQVVVKAIVGRAF